jgi:hypothetical protein
MDGNPKSLRPSLYLIWFAYVWAYEKKQIIGFLIINEDFLQHIFGKNQWRSQKFYRAWAKKFIANSHVT